MNTTSRTRAAAVLAAALVLLTGLVWSSGTSATAATAATDRPHHGYSRAQAEKLLAEVQQALAPGKASARRAAARTPRRDLGLLLHRLQVARPALSEADQAAAIDASQRPVPASAGCADYQPLLGAKWTASASTHFCLHYRTAGAGAATPTWVQTTLSVLEHVYATEVSSLGYRKPLDDGDHLDDVFLDQIGDQGYYGFCTTDDGTATSTAWCELDNDFAQSEFGAPPANSLRVTAAHEFFHAIQFAYDANDSTWFLEGTAVWMEDQVYPAINDYLQYLTYSQITQSEVPIDTTGTFERYGAVIFWKYLSEGYHDVPGGHVRIYRGTELESRLAAAGLTPSGSHHAHALHSPYWWLNCALGKESLPSRLYHRVLVWDIMKRPWLTRFAEQALNPVLGKSLVMYADKPAAAGVAGAAA